MDTIEVVNVFGKSLEIFNTIYPIGFTYPQYPGQKDPNELWGDISTWEELNYGGAFFRAAGGNADGFSVQKEVTGLAGTVLTIVGHGASAGCIVYDLINNESRTIAEIVDDDTIKVNSPFSHTTLTFVLITQKDATAKNGLSGWADTTYNSDKTAQKSLTGHASAGQSQGLVASDSVWGICGVDGYYGAGPSLIGSSVYYGMGINATHTHALSLEGDSETRCVNFTYKLWKRIS